MAVSVAPARLASDVSSGTSSTPIARTVDPAFEERWAAWIARGHRHDAALRRKLRFVAIAGVPVLMLVILGLGVFGGSL